MSGTNKYPGQIPIWAPGKEPLPPGITEEERPLLEQQKKWENYAGMAMESCVAKTTIAGTMGIGIGLFFSLMQASFAYEDPILRQQMQSGMTRTQKTSQILKEMGKNAWSSGKGFGKIGALYAGIECCIEGYRAKNDIYNSVSSGFLAGAVLARNSGPKAAFGGGLAFAAFSCAIDLFLRRETPEED